MKRQDRALLNNPYWNYIVPTLFILGFAFISTYPAFMEHFFANSNDGMVHIARIESIYQAIKSGRVPSLINFIGFGNQGQALNAMYPWLTLLIFVIPKLVVHNAMVAFTAGFFVLNVLTIFNIYLLAKYLTNNKWIQWLGVISFQFNAYHLQVMYSRVALGEAFGYAFLPLVLLGMFKIWNREKGGVIYVALGMSLIANSHVLSLIIVTMFIAVVEILRLFQRKLDWYELKSFIFGALITIAMSAYSLYNILTWVFHNNMVSPTPSVYALDPTNAFSRILSNDFSQTANGAHMGIAMMVILGILLITAFQGNQKGNWVSWSLGSTALLILIQDWLPWSYLINTPAQLFQFFMRFLIIVAICLTIGLILFFDQKNNISHALILMLSLFIMFIGVTGTAALHQRFRGNYLWATSHTRPQNLVKNRKLHYLTNGNYKENMTEKMLVEYHLKKTNEKGIPSINTQTSVTNVARINSMKVDFDYKGAKHFKNIYSSDQEAVYKFNQKKAKNVKIPVVGYSNVNYLIKVNGKKVSYVLSQGQLMVKLPTGRSRILVSVVNSSKHAILLLVSVISFLIGGIRLFPLNKGKSKRIFTSNEVS